MDSIEAENQHEFTGECQQERRESAANFTYVCLSVSETHDSAPYRARREQLVPFVGESFHKILQPWF